MANVTYRVPWRAPYGYAEITFDTEEYAGYSDAQMQELYIHWANHALIMEDAVKSLGGGAKAFSPAADEAVSRGAEYIHNDGAGNDPPQNSTPRMDQGEPCQLCGKPATQKTTKTGKRVLQCGNGCMDDVNGRHYPHTVRWL